MKAIAPKLMLVENDPYFIYLLKLYAEQSGFVVINTNSGLNALSLAEEERPTVIVLESDLPEVTGWEILQDLRSRPLTHEIPVVMCLWHDSQQLCDMTHTERLLRKPMQYEDFVVALKGVGVWPENGPAKPTRPPLTSLQD